MVSPSEKRHASLLRLLLLLLSRKRKVAAATARSRSATWGMISGK